MKQELIILGISLAVILLIALLYPIYQVRKNTKIIEKHDETYKYNNPLADGRFRNQRCPCGSGKKMKQCHGKEQFITASQRVEYMEMVRVQMNNIANSVNQNLKQD